MPDRIHDLTRIRYELGGMLASGSCRLYEDGRYISDLDSTSCCAEYSHGKLILSCWGEGWSRSWRILACEAGRESLRFECTKQMGRTRCVVELGRAAPVGEALSRKEFASSLAELVESQFPAFRVERAVASRDDQSHLSGLQARLTVKERGRLIAAIGVSDRESQLAIDATLGAGLIWLDLLRQKRGAVDRLVIFAPRGRVTTIATRLTAVKPPGATITLYEIDIANKTIGPVAAFDQGDLIDQLKQAGIRPLWPRERELPRHVAALARSIEMLAPGLVDTSLRGGWLSCSIKGLEFARVSIARGRVEFGIGDARMALSDKNRHELQLLAGEIAARRSPEFSLRTEPLFRMQSERWLESVIRRNVTLIDPTLDPRHIYSQVPAYRGEQRSFIDLLAVTREGRLVVIELKVAEDSEFPLQGLDYWLRVEWHRHRGDFERRGYFKGVQIAAAEPLLYLIAPLFRFHATTHLIARSFSDRVAVYRIGINEEWRRSLRVLSTERLR